MVQSSTTTFGSSRCSASQSVSTRYSGWAKPASCRQFRQFDQHIAGGRRIEERDARAAMADARRLVAQLYALRLQFGERAVDVLDLEADVEQALALFGDPLVDAGSGACFPAARYRSRRPAAWRGGSRRSAPRIPAGCRTCSRSRSIDCLSEFTAMAMCSTRLIFMCCSSGNRHAAVHRIDLPGDHAEFVGCEKQRHVGDVLRFDQAEQMRVRQLVERGVAGDQLAHAIGHRRRWRDGVDAHLLRRELHRHRAGHRRDPALRGGVAIAAGDAHQRDVRRHVDDRTAAGLDDRRDAERGSRGRCRTDRA